MKEAESSLGYLSGKRIVVTGGAGFLGSAVCEQLREHNPERIFVPRSADYDLRNREAICQLLTDHRPEIVIHLAALIGGIGANEEEPGRYFYDNAVMGVELIEHCRKFGVEKMVLGGSVCESSVRRLASSIRTVGIRSQ